MALLSVIRRWHLREKMSIREIARRTGLSRNTDPKYLAASTLSRSSRFPNGRASLTLLPTSWRLAEDGGRQVAQAAAHGEADARRSGGAGLHRLLRPGGGLCAGLEGRAPAGAADERARHLRAAGLCPGEAFQFDWSEDWAVLGGERTKLQVAHTKLSHSRAFIVRAYLLQTHEMLFDAHDTGSGCWAAFPARDLRQHEDGRRPDRPRQGPAGQRPVLGHGQPLPVRARVLQSGLGLGEGPGREERPGCPAPAVAADAALSRPRRAERLAGGALPGAVARYSTWHPARHHRRCLGRGEAA